MSPEVVRFLRCLPALRPAEIRRRAADLRARQQEPGYDLTWWRATAATEGTLRRNRSTAVAASASRAAFEAVVEAARSGGVTLDEDVRELARSAAETARSLVAGMHPRDGDSSPLAYLVPCSGYGEAA